MPTEFPVLSERLEAVEERIQGAVRRAGRQRSDITLVAVTKKFSAQTMREAYAAGLRVFGENYVQEWAEKRGGVGTLGGATYHLIGHLQSNKAKVAAELFDAVQTVDSAKLMRRLDVAAGERQGTLEVLVEVKLSGEENKTGANAADLAEITAAAAACRHLRLTGLMTMPPWSENPEDSRPYFRQLATLAREYKLPTLSMGMSADFEVAIEEGATLIRVGTALFGPRPRPTVGAVPKSE